MLQSLKILVQDQGRLVPSQGGILLYGKERRFYFDDAWVQCGRFIGNDKGDIFDHIDIHDPLPMAVDSIILFLKKHAMRGVVINALVHADYSHRGTQIRVAFFDDRIEIESPGLLLPGLTIEDMKLGISQIRNPIIARVFRELDLIEQWGSGVPGVFREAKTLDLPEPTIEEIGMRVRFTVYLKEAVTPSAEQSRKSLKEKRPGPEAPSGVESGVESGGESEMAHQVMDLLQDTQLSKSEIARALGKSKPTRYLNDLVKKLLENRYVAYTIPEKPNSRLQKYRITGQGKALLQAREDSNE